MSENENIVKLPDALERRALKIEAAITRRNKGDDEWIEGTLDLAVELTGARDEHGSNDNTFGEWLEKRFHNIMIPRNERAILIQWGKDPAQARLLLEKRETNSIQMIHRGYRNSTITSPSIAPTLRVNKVEEVAKVIKAETGQWPTHKTLTEVAGVNRRNADNALRTVKAVEAATAAPPTLLKHSKAQEYEIEAQIRVRRYELEKEFDERATKETKARIDLLFPRLEQMRKDAERNEKYYRESLAKIAIFKESEYMDILKACHPDNSASKEVRERAFIAISTKKLQLTGKK